MTPYLLNLADLIFTLHALSMGGVELNPLMRHIPIMVGYKVIVIGALCRWLSRQDTPLAAWGLRACTAVYGGLCAYHIINIIRAWI